MRARRVTLLAALLAFQGCTCGWGQGDTKGCDANIVSDDGASSHGYYCNSLGGVCTPADNPCPLSEQLYADCYTTEVCCANASDASADASPDQGSEASFDARSEADAAIADGAGDATLDGGDADTDANTADSTTDDVMGE
jgi:hypothetical protein